MWKPINRVSRAVYATWTEEQKMDDCCANCGCPYGKHGDEHCPPKDLCY